MIIIMIMMIAAAVIIRYDIVFGNCGRSHLIDTKLSTDLREASNATKNGKTQPSQHCITHNRSITLGGVEERWDLGACPQKTFSEPHPPERRKMPFWSKR